jgi:hypothetical protein
LPRHAEISPEEWGVVATYRDLGEAQVARGFLEANELHCLLADHEIIRLDWRLSTALHGIKLRVRSADLQRARELLDADYQIESELRSDTAPEDLPGIACSRCASKEVTFLNLAQKWSLAFLLLGVPFFGRRWGFKCRACNYSWRASTRP